MSFYAGTGMHTGAWLPTTAPCQHLLRGREMEVGMRDWRSEFRELEEERQQMMADGSTYRECKHPSSELRALTCTNGAIQYVQQCRMCGEKLGSPVAHSRVSGAVNPFDRELPKRWMEQARKGMSAQEREQAFRRKWWGLYTEYLKSPEWKRLRERVLERATGTCEGCGDEPPSQAHHLSYKHVGGELLFELVAVCKSCHERCHEDHEE